MDPHNANFAYDANVNEKPHRKRKAAQEVPAPLTPFGEELQQKSFRYGVRSLRILVREEMDKPNHVMPHTHNPDVQPEYHWDYCWRCKIERVLDSQIEGYKVHCLREVPEVPEERKPQIQWNKVSDGLPSAYGEYLVVRGWWNNGVMLYQVSVSEFHPKREEVWYDRGFIYTHWFGPISKPEMPVKEFPCLIEKDPTKK